MYEFGNLVGGRWVPGAAGDFQTVNPAHPRSAVGRYSAASREQVGAMVGAARSAQRAWRALPSVERGAVFGRFLAALEARAEDLAKSITLEQGKPLAEAHGEVAKAIAEGRFMAGEAARGHSEMMPSARPRIRNMVVRRPRGVIAAITPWNFPILTPMRKISPALVFGNAIILKPSEFTPATACLVAETARDMLPDGLLQIANGRGDTGAALVGATGISGVTFTGSVATGKQIYALAAENLAEISLELGGKNAAVINDADDLQGCLDQIMTAACMCAGQRCTAISRVIVRRPLLEAVLDGLIRRSEAAVLGDGMQPGTTMGPLTNERQLARVAAMVEAGVKEGARLLTGGRPVQVAGCDEGYFYAPTVLAGVSPEMSVAREEIFGPVISVLSYDDVDEAFRILNGVEHGLTSALFSNDNAIVQRFVDESENGMLHVNHGTIPDNHMPFGGVKSSGVGAYSVGASAANFYTTEHSVYIRHD
ncbi:MAG TPA: aldehyde dehydrogenase family protein [Casimicrobiaceae bacterium]|nr:aldehyde dehydrogenase family protein [Casimicrobiaceae bacterium]